MSRDLEPEFPLRTFLGFELEIVESKAIARLDLSEQHLNPNQVAHGAVAFTMMDTAMGAAVMNLLSENQACTTIEMQTRFHRAVSSGDLRAEATVLSPGKRIVHLEARVFDDQNRLVASSTGSFAVITPRQT